jgi:ParB family chromosome partitioning protein
MRHDSHFVEEITSTRSESIGRLIDLDRIEPNPHQPRKNFGDLSEMVASIKEKGVLEPILVRALEGGKFEIIAGERRYQASKIAGLHRVPAIEVDVDNRGKTSHLSRRLEQSSASATSSGTPTKRSRGSSESPER